MRGFIVAMSLIFLMAVGLRVFAEPTPTATPAALVTVPATEIVPCEQLAAVDPVFVPPTWLQTVVLWVKDLPVAGPILVEVGKWAGVVVTFLTALSIFLLGILRGLQPVTKLSFVGPWVVKVLEVLGKILPYVQYLSVFNVQKKDEKSKA